MGQEQPCCRWALPVLFIQRGCVKSPYPYSLSWFCSSAINFKCNDATTYSVHLGNIMSCSNGYFNTMEWWGQEMREDNTSGGIEFVCMCFTLKQSRFLLFYLQQFTSVYELHELLSCTSVQRQVLKWRSHTLRHFPLECVCVTSLWLARLSLWLQRPWPSQHWGLDLFSQCSTQSFTHTHAHTGIHPVYLVFLFHTSGFPSAFPKVNSVEFSFFKDPLVFLFMLHFSHDGIHVLRKVRLKLCF